MYRLMIVDDEQNIREGLRDSLDWNRLGFEVAGLFENGKTALDYIERYDVDVVLSDVKMPVMDGMELARQIREQGRDTVIIFLSGYAEFEYARQALAYGVHSYELKPLNREHLALTLTRVREELDNIRNGGEAEPPKGYYDQIRHAVQQYVQENYRDATLESAALTVSMSPNYLSRIFKRKTGQSFSEYLTEVKMKKAEELLRDIELKIYEISFEVGYDNPKNFTRAFKQYSGKTPREFRESGG